MNPKFLSLSKEKQSNILNAGMEMFGKHGYKKAVTDDIASKAGISKGLLFYYFHNKKEFYLYLYDYCVELMMQKVRLEEIKEIDDFFDLLDYGAQKKLELISKYPYILNFIIKAYYSQKEPISSEMNQRIQDMIDYVFDMYFQYIDISRFKEGIDVKYICHMLLWMGDGYLMEKQRMGERLNVDEMLKDFREWMIMFKRMSYKEEYL